MPCLLLLTTFPKWVCKIGSFINSTRLYRKNTPAVYRHVVVTYCLHSIRYVEQYVFIFV